MANIGGGGGGGTRMLSPVSNASGTRLSTYFMVIGTILFTVLLLTVSSMQFLETAFGNWGKGPGHNRDQNGASSIRIRNVTHVASKNNDKINSVKNSIDWIDQQQTEIILDQEEIEDTQNEDDEEEEEEEEGDTNEETEEDDENENEIVLDEGSKDEIATDGEWFTNPKKDVDGTTDVIIEVEDDDDDDVVEVVVGEIDVINIGGGFEDDQDDTAVEAETEEEEDEDNEDNENNEDEDDYNNNKLSLLDSVLKARKKMIQKLKKDYGNDYYDKIFHISKSKSISTSEYKKKKNKDTQDPDRPRSTHMMQYNFIRPIVYTDREGHRSDYTNDAMRDKIVAQNNINNFQRKLIIKILRAQKNPSSNKNNNNNNKYVWATGGHSASAGHGNLFEESYTKIFESTASKVFQAAGLILETRNYAMGATSSASEMSMCYNEIYGTDIDIFSWDFGMLEARDYLKGRMLHYIMRGLLSTSSASAPFNFNSKYEQPIVPAFIGLQEINEPRKQIIQQLNDAFMTTTENTKNDVVGNDGNDSHSNNNNGLALFLGDNDLFQDMKDSIPDTFGLSSNEILSLPTHVRNFKCNESIEKGEPYCGSEKYTMDQCPKRMGMASWHPGWKYHAMIGNSIALFMIDQLIESIQIIHDYEIDATSGSTDLLLEKLLEEEEVYRQMLFNGPLPKFAQTVYWYNNTSDRYDDHPSQDDYFIRNNRTIPTEEIKQKFYHPIGKNESNIFFRGPSLCHTARLPSQTRYDGTLINHPIRDSDNFNIPKISEVIWTNVSFYKGIEDIQLDEINSKKLELELEQQETEQETEQESKEVQSRRPLQLSYVMKGEREQFDCPDCTAVTHIDYRDFFYIESESILGKDVWTTFEFPNQAEQQQYNYQQNLEFYNGYLILIFRFCGFDQCEDGFLGQNEYNNGSNSWNMMVNNDIVTRMTKIGHSAIILENSNGLKFKPNKNGVYDIKLKVNDPKGFLKISAFVLY
ncbi:hypothetical protein FRACYDRAFT_263649 [Fragilariopsis cylindrus CCMP1102]|uniref:Uncharacterized protein n=1 Tax=Fragilariopsis cylindrus CCMP1102 TaxID=635003 RepID=A0A1E7EZM1_9STRA|nr:hypothetical protein FRACYDRAFT_263649 [Fragilariopsis cylindrus CCMP1102]|eukprot:OEU11245.1 hypothetical protein FRACYDRAFT_263649 [Fragilariopsis cylindrus CCMP1102]